MFSISALKNKNIRRVVASQTISQICDKLMLVAIMWVIADKYAAAWVPWYVVAGGLPHLALAGFSGRIIAQLKIMPTLIGSEVFRGAILLAFPFLVPSETPDITAFLALAFLTNLGAALFNPAILSLPLTICDDEARPQANAMIDACFSFANVIGPVLSVGLFAKYGLKNLMLLNGFSYLLAALIQAGVRPLSEENSQPTAETIAAPSKPTPLFEIFRREHLMRQMMLTFLGINLFGAPFVMLFPLYVKQIYHLDLAALATLETSFGAGAVAGAVALSLVHFSKGLGPRIIFAVLAVGMALVAFSLSTSLPIGSVALFGMGLCLAMANVWILTLFQSAVPPGDVPSVMGLVNMISVAATPISLAVTGLIMERFPVNHIALTASIAFSCIGCVLLFFPRLKEV